MTPRTTMEILGALIAAFLIWHFAQPHAAPVNTWTQAKSAPQVAAVPTQTLQCKPVIVYAKEAKQKLDLPAEVKSDANQYVLSTAQIRAGLRPETMTTVYDDQTGKSVVLVKSDPYPWLAAENVREFRLDYGLKNGLERVGRFSFREDLLQVKAVHLGINTSLDTDGDYFIGAGVGYRW